MMAGLIEMLFMLFFAYIALQQTEHTVAGYKVHWFMGAPIINPRGAHTLAISPLK